MSKTIFQYKFTQIFRHAKGLGFKTTEAESSGYDEKGNLIITNGAENPQLKAGAYIKMFTGFTGYNGKEAWHNKFFPFVNFKVVEAINYGDGTLGIIVNYPAIAPGSVPYDPSVPADIIDTDDAVPQIFNEDNWMVFADETVETTEQETFIEATGMLTVSPDAFPIAKESLQQKLVSVPDDYKCEHNTTHGSTPTTKSKSNIKNLLLLIIIILILIAVFKYIVK